MSKYAIGAAFGAVALLGVAAAGIEAVQRSAYTPEYGADYLRDEGHLVLKGGERDYFNTCGRGVFARNYQTVQHNAVQDVTVCFSPFWGRYQPFLF